MTAGLILRRLGLAATMLALATSIIGPQPPPVQAGTSPFTDIEGSPHAADIEWLAERGITNGCNPPDYDRFCPKGVVSRQEMASFIARALELPVAVDDHFTDDTGSVHEPDINRMREAHWTLDTGITTGCNEDGTLYCPSASVLRQQMASFLIRGLKWYWLQMGLRYEPDHLPLAGSGGFEDVPVGAPHHPDILGLRWAEPWPITRGCNEAGTLYCPGDPVTREQMASFLHRAIITLDYLPRTAETVELGVVATSGFPELQSREFTSPQASIDGVDFSEFTYIIDHDRWQLLQVSGFEWRADLLDYDLQSPTEVAVDAPFYPSCTVTLDGELDIHVYLGFHQTPDGSISLEVEHLNPDTSRLDANGSGGYCSDPSTGAVDEVVGLFLVSLEDSFLLETELCRGDDTSLFAPCPAP